MRAIWNVDDGHFAQESRLCGEASFAQYVFTDGSARKISQEMCAGRGFTVMKSNQSRDEIPMVQIAEGGEYCVGAIHATKNTAEMRALIEALFWLNIFVEQDNLPIFSNVMITVDSLYVKGLIDEKFVAGENRALATLLCHMWTVTKNKLQLHIRWVRGRTGDVGNSIADEVADVGTRLEAQHGQWKRVQPMGEWEEDVFKSKDVEFTKRSNTVECVKWCSARHRKIISPSTG